MFRSIVFSLCLIPLFVVTGPAAAGDATVFVGSLVDASDGGYSYGYAPAIVYENGIFHKFYCSNGQDGFWDSIRYTWSGDGRSWAPPRIILTANTHEVERCACDPSVVRYDAGDGPYYYLFYSGNRPDVQTVMFVARSPAIDGPYAKRTSAGTWEPAPPDPEVILGPAHPVPPGWYGAGQQTVVVVDGRLYSWFHDDSARYPDYEARIFQSTADDPGRWSPPVSTNVSGVASVEVRYDPETEQFVMFHFIQRHQRDAALARRFSADGITWSDAEIIADRASIPDYAHNPGASADPSGHLVEGRSLIVYGAPSSQPARWMEWDLVGTALNPAGQVWNEIPWGWQWPGMEKTEGSSTDALLEKLFPYIEAIEGWGDPFSDVVDEIRRHPVEVVPGDFDGDGRADRAIVVRETSRWYVISSATGEPVADIPWGWQWSGMGDQHRIAPGDFDGDGRTDRAIVDENTGHWYVIASSTGEPYSEIPWGWQWKGMVKEHRLALGDYDGDGRTDRAVVNPISGRWYIIASSTGGHFDEIPWGWQWPGMGDRHHLALGDYDGDGRTDRAIVDGNTGRWYVFSSRTGGHFDGISWGWEWSGWSPEGHRLAVGDYDGDGRADRAIVNAATGQWYVISSRTGGAFEEIPWGWKWTGMEENHVVSLGDYDGDGRTDPAIVDPETMRWYVRPSTPFTVYTDSAESFPQPRSLRLIGSDGGSPWR